MHYFGFSFLTIFDSLLALAGILIAVDGLLWYLPVRKEQAEIPDAQCRCEACGADVKN
jgi:hypothetical protein